ncbi:unnamed protein product, partial [Hydatigera taeniaeformis]|uniref:Hexosyltransferase n=1 Tax=Hydatigena taeniaeformis TaxID=6205 RepID=A0A0R3WWI4_HYDTA
MEVSARRLMPSKRKTLGLGIVVTIVYAIYVYVFHFSSTASWIIQPYLDDTYCTWNDSIYAHPDGHYQLHLCYTRVSKASSPADTPLTIKESKIRINGSSKRLRFEDLASIPDAEWLQNFDPSVYLLYPQSIPVRETLQSLIDGKPIPQPPIYNPWIQLLQVPSRVCAPLTATQATLGPTDTSSLPNVVIVYKSGVYNFEVRSKLRQLYRLHYPDINAYLIFSIGLPRTLPGNVFVRDGFNVTLTNRAGNKLIEHSRHPSKTTKMLAQEMREHDDLLVGDYEDSYYNLTLKLFHTFQWAARLCRPYKPIFVFLDDDYAVNINKLGTFVRGLTPQLQEDLNCGFEVMVNPVFRPNSVFPQWAFSKREIPWPRHTPQYLGIFSMWSYRNVHDAALAMHFTKPMVIDDTWLGMLQYKLNITFSRLEGMFPESVQIPPHTTCSDIFFALLSE